MNFKSILSALFVFLFVAGAMGQSGDPKTPRQFFRLLSQDFFYLENLRADNSPYSASQLRTAQDQYLKLFLEVEDNKNGFMRCGGDGSQESFQLALFKRPNGSYLAGVYVWGEWGDKYYFLEYQKGKLKNISRTVIPRYKRSNKYEIPRYGTTVRVFERKNFSAEDDQGEEGRHLYDLVWKNGKFVIQNVRVDGN